MSRGALRFVSEPRGRAGSARSGQRPCQLGEAPERKTRAARNVLFK